MIYLLNQSLIQLFQMYNRIIQTQILYNKQDEYRLMSLINFHNLNDIKIDKENDDEYSKPYLIDLMKVALAKQIILIDNIVIKFIKLYQLIIQQFKIQMSKKNTIFTPARGPKISFVNQLYHPYFDGMNENQFPQLGSMLNLLTNPALKRLYDLMIQNIQAHLYKDAIFFGDKLLTLSNGNLGIVYLLGQCYFYNNDFKKVHSLFVKYKVICHNINFQVLAAKATLNNKQYQLCASILEMQLDNPYFNKKLESAKYMIKAQCCEANQNKITAITMYYQCLKKDPTCVQAFNRLIDCNLLSNTEKQQLLTMLNFNPEDVWIKKYYKARIKQQLIQPKKKEGIEQQIQIKSQNIFEILNSKNNIDILCIQAKNAHTKYNIPKAYQICLKAIKQDPLYFQVIPIFCACLLDLNYLGQLYYCAHNLVQNYSNHSLSWFAVGTYYFLTKKYQISRKYFQKAIMLDRNFIYAWIGMAHSFAIQDQSDQAMSVYRTISRLFPGCYSAHLYMGMEYLRTNNLKTSLLSLHYAKQINSNDPLIYNQIGVIYYKQKEYIQAKNYYTKALQLCEDATNWIIQTILSNLAHCYRKIKDYKNSIKYLEKCVTLNPQNPQTYFSLAFAYHLSNQLNKAICYYHKSLKYKHDNQFAQDMLAKALTDASDLPWETVYNI